MMRNIQVYVVLLCCCSLLQFTQGRVIVPRSDTTIGYNVVAPDNFTVLRKGIHGGNLYEMAAEGAVYEHLPYLMDMHGTRYQHGFDAGYTQVDMMQYTYQTFLASVLHPAGPFEPAVQYIVELFLDWQWKDYLSKQVPAEYIEESKGLHDGCLQALNDTSWGRQFQNNDSFVNCDTLWNRVQVLANLPGSIGDLKYVLANEFNISLTDGQIDETWLETSVNNSPVGQKAKFVGENLYMLLTRKLKAIQPAQCSMIAAWGSRSNDSQLYSGRNLDWLENTGANRYKAIYVFHPKGKNPHVTVGYAGLLGALTGMSSRGLTVHEANLEESPETFFGFPWLLRLRNVMENCDNLESAKKLWENTNNTVGFNHMVASATDKSAIVMETQALYTAYFRADDPREKEAVVDGVHTGFPLNDALWRTNHGYDPQIMKDFLWSQKMGTDTEERYMMIHDAIVDYQQRNEGIAIEQMINVTSLAGKKGPNYYKCGNTHSGSNVLSVAFDPSRVTMYAAWEGFSGDSWRPAACNSYLQLNMTQWF